MSSANPKVQEPSMEEILASIRRIIADDQENARAAPGSPPPPAASAPVEDDVLDLADLQPVSAAAAKLDMDHEDISFRDADGQIDFDAIPIDDEPEPEPEPPPPQPVRAAVPKREPEPEPFSVPDMEDTLLSAAANSSVSQAFGMLSTTVLNSHPRTLEDLVKEMLRPMLKAWLDENLPPMVERLVKAEIERVARGGR